jgi:hypothetical protein
MMYKEIIAVCPKTPPPHPNKKKKNENPARHNMFIQTK